MPGTELFAFGWPLSLGFTDWNLLPAALESLAWSAAWQATVWLLLGLAAAYWLRRKPAVAHAMLVVACIGCPVTPLLSLVARQMNLGVLSTEITVDNSKVAGIMTQDRLPETMDAHLESAAKTIERSNAATPVDARTRTNAGTSSFVAAPARLPTAKGAPPAFLRLRSSLLSFAATAWTVIALALLVRLIVSFCHGARLARAALPVQSAALRRSLAQAATQTQTAAPVILRKSSWATCPMLWAWGRGPKVVVPETADADGNSTVTGVPPVDWTSVFCHELAHWRRRDHWWTMLANVVVAGWFWNPLAWLVRRKMETLSEEASDDWVVWSGCENTSYADSLLQLTPAFKPGFALPAVRRPSTLGRRIKRLLSNPKVSPRVGLSAASLVLAMAFCIGSSLVLAQPRREQSQPSGDGKVPDTAKPVTTSVYTYHGQVLTPDGKPAAGATVYAASNFTDWRGSFGQSIRSPKKTQVVAKTTTDPDGRYQITFEPVQKSGGNFIVAQKDGFAMTFASINAKVDPDKITFADPQKAIDLKLCEVVTIEGILVTASGKPAIGACVEPVSISSGIKTPKYFNVSNWFCDEPNPEFLPSAITDAAGRFILPAMPHGFMTILQINHPDAAIENVAVDLGMDEESRPYLNRIGAKPAKFTHALPVSRSIRGKVTDARTKAPLADVAVQITTNTVSRGFFAAAITDKNGEYRSKLPIAREGDGYSILAAPPPGSRYLNSSDGGRHRPDAGQTELRMDFAMKSAAIVRGSVIDSETKRPIAGAKIRALVRNDERLLQASHSMTPAVTDEKGRFEAIAIPGANLIVVDGPTNDYIRSFVPQNLYFPFFKLTPHAYVATTANDAGENAEVALELRRGVSVELKIVKPDNSPVTSFERAMLGNPSDYNAAQNMGARAEGSTLKLPGCDPRYSRRIYILDSSNHLGGMFDVKPSADGDNVQNAKLSPTGTIRGKVTDAKGRPNAEAEIFAYLDLEQPGDPNAAWATTPLVFNNFVRPPPGAFPTNRVRPDGTFEIQNVIAGAKIHLRIQTIRRGLAPKPIVVVPLKPGEIREIGSIQ